MTPRYAKIIENFDTIKRPRKYNLGTYTIEVIGASLIPNGIEILARAWVGTIQIGFGPDGSVDVERFKIINPPTLVQDNNGGITKEYTVDDGQPPKVVKYRESVIEALTSTISETIRIVGKPGSPAIIPGKVGSTVATIYATETSTGLLSNLQTTWAGVRDGATGTGVSTTAMQISTSKVSGTDWRISRGMCAFDTSVVGTGATINSATLSILQFNRSFEFTARTANITKSTKTDSTTLVAADFGTMEHTDLSTDLMITNPASDTWRDWAFNSTGLSAINKSGYSFFVGRPCLDIDNSPPTDSQNTSFYSSSEAGTTKDPKIVIDYTTSTTNSGFFAFM